MRCPNIYYFTYINNKLIYDGTFFQLSEEQSDSGTPLSLFIEKRNQDIGDCGQCFCGDICRPVLLEKDTSACFSEQLFSMVSVDAHDLVFAALNSVQKK
jgi:hypothetical protein